MSEYDTRAEQRHEACNTDAASFDVMWYGDFRRWIISFFHQSTINLQTRQHIGTLTISHRLLPMTLAIHHSEHLTYIIFNISSSREPQCSELRVDVIGSDAEDLQTLSVAWSVLVLTDSWTNYYVNISFAVKSFSGVFIWKRSEWEGQSARSLLFHSELFHFQNVFWW